MMDGYRVLLASDVSNRDGLGLELYDTEGQLAEIFRDDDTGETGFTVTSSRGIPFDVLEEYVLRARHDLGEAE